MSASERIEAIKVLNYLMENSAFTNEQKDEFAKKIVELVKLLD